MRHQAYLYDHNVAEMTASIFTSEKRKPSPGTNNQTPISLNFQRGKLSVDGKNYTIVTQNMAVIT